LAVALFIVLPTPKFAVHSGASIRLGRSLAFILGACFSALTGFVGMWLAVRANVRTAYAAKESGLRRAIRIAFRAGGVAGMFTLFVRAVGVVTSMVGILTVVPRSETEHGMAAINRGFFVSAAISAAAVFVISGIYLDSYRPAFAVLFGLVLASVIQLLT